MRSILSCRGRAGAGTLCDLSAGAGYHTLAYAADFDTVIHCDLSSANLAYASARAAGRRLRNVAFLRIDYLRPPFRHSLPLVVCFDTLIRGPAHEGLLLQAIRGSLAPRGTAVVDFHNIQHSVLRRVGLLRQNFAGNRSYTRRAAEALVHGAGLDSEYFPFRQELEPGSRLERTIGKIIPPVRHVFRISRDSSHEP